MPFRQFPRRVQKQAEGLFAESTPEHYLVANIDGGARGNPGPAGYGVAIADEQGNPVAEIYEYLGTQTNNFAEYTALLAALEYALAQRAPALRVLSDSELLVKQINGEYKVSNPVLKELHARAVNMIRKFEWFTIRHVRRERNKEADALANKAMDYRKPGQVIRTPKASVEPAEEKTARECEGVVRGGRVELNERLPEGARVRVVVID